MLDPPSYSMYVFDTTYVCHLHIRTCTIMRYSTVHVWPGVCCSRLVDCSTYVYIRTYVCMYVLCPRLFHLLQGAVQLALTLSSETEDHVLAATAWSLGQIGRHTPEHAKAVATSNVLPCLLDLHLRQDSSEDLVMKVRCMRSSYTPPSCPIFNSIPHLYMMCKIMRG